MQTNTGTAIVTHEDRMVPIAGDGDCASVPVPAPTIESALASFDWQKYRGFRFVDVVKATIALEDGKEETFKEERGRKLSYIFAQSVMTADQIKASTDDAVVKFREYATSYVLDNKDNLYYTTGAGIRTLEKYAQGNTVLITREGQKLFTPK